MTEHPTDHRPLSVLFVCTANICRSPYMELATRRLLDAGSGIEVSSAGTHGFVAPRMSEEMISGYETEATSFRSRRATVDLVEAADLVLTAEAAHRTYLLEESPGAFRKVFTLGQFAEAVTALGPEPLTGRALITEVGGHRSQADPRHDVDDPYRKGPEVARACAARIDELLAIVVPALRPTRASQ
jgi:sulfate adenylyltransferase